MRLTRVLSNIVCILITAIFIILLYVYKDNIQESITETVNIINKNKIIIPEEKYNIRDYTFDTVTSTEDFEPNNLQELKNIYYTVLNNGWDSFTFYCPVEYESCISDVLSIAKNSEYLELVNYYVSPYNNYTLYNTTVSTSGEVFLQIDKVYNDSEVEYLKKFVDETIVGLGINPSKPTKNDIKKIHDYLINKISYDNEYNDTDINSNSNNAYGAIVDNKAICSGYTDAFAIFLDRLKIKNIKLPSENHIWNYIYFEGKWYHIDLTWDDDEVHKNNTTNYFMINTKKLFELDNEKHNFKKELFLETSE